MQQLVEHRARQANSADRWDRLWGDEGSESWRKEALSVVYDRVDQLIPEKKTVIDIGGGVGLLAKILAEEDKRDVTVWDHSPAALEQVPKEVETVCVDLELDGLPELDPSSFIVATEVLEHLSAEARDRLLSHVSEAGCKAIFSVPNNRLGPDEEPQHTIKFTALEFLNCLRDRFEHARVEVVEHFLIGVCNFPKGYKMSVTMPARDEAEDLAFTLASFRGVADEMVIGIDPRTEDNSFEIAKQYAEVVFEIEDPQGPEDDRMPDGGVHFSWIRNQCMDRCTGDWIFMTEAHESLNEGMDVLLAIEHIMPKGAKVGYVLRTGQGQRWAFPWLCRNEKQFRYKRATHNVLDFPEGTGCVKLPQVVTLHERVEDRSKARVEQRKVQNRRNLMEDWVVNRNENSLFYLGQEWRATDNERAINHFQKFLITSNNGAARYQARLMLAKIYSHNKDMKSAWEVLMQAASDDWSRIEHWIWLGDIAFEDNQYEQALQFYRYAGTTIDEPPFTLWWIDLSMYGYLAAERLAMCFSHLGRYQDSLYWAEKVLNLLPEDSPEEAFDEARKIIASLKEAIEQ